ncbi:L,D-transpeptidase [Bacteroidia bacterium]|nr:L,D-transpeptidase [Bacteroidia bacterium]
MIYIHQWYNKKVEQIENANFIIISKQEMMLYMYDYRGNEMFKFPVACGLNYGNKEKRGDMKTPEGIFRVSEIQKAAHWTHDFKDGKGEIKGAYGPYFIRLEVPEHQGIGIHGTHDPKSLGTRATEGCIRLKNENVLQLVELVHPGTVVVITASTDDLKKTANLN